MSGPNEPSDLCILDEEEHTPYEWQEGKHDCTKYGYLLGHSKEGLYNSAEQN